MTAPPDLRDFDERIAQVRRDKESAIDAQDFERAAQLRDKEKQLLAQKAQREKEWKAGDLDVVSEVDDEQIAEVLANWTGIPVYKLTEEETARLLRMEDELHKRIVGQEDAVKAVSKAIRRTRAGLKDPKRPSGSFIFAGPSGVGKTELSKALAEFLFGSEDALIQLDMSRVPRPVHGVAAGRCPARVRRLRRGWPADREGAPPAVLGGPVRRDREGPPGRVQHAAADPGGRSAHRRSGPHRGLQEHGDHPDHQPGHPGRGQGGVAGLPGVGGRREPTTSG